MSDMFYSFGPFRIDPRRRTLWREGKIVSLAPKAFEMLLLLVENEGRVLEKQELMGHLWPGSIVEEANLSQTVYLLRRALSEGSDGRQYIETMPKRGYRFAAEIVESLDERSESITPGTAEAGSFDAAYPDNHSGRLSIDSNIEEESGAFRNQPGAVHSRALSHRAIWIAGIAASLVVSVAVYLWISRQSSKTGPAGTVHSMAVLPFKSIGADGDDNYLGLGMADALITRLSSVNEIVIQPTGAIRKYDDENEHPLEVGRELAVDAVLEGTLQKTTDRLRVTLRLHDVRDGRTLWSGKFDENFTDIFTVQDSISDQIVAALALNLTREMRGLMLKRYTDNAEAYELYLKGRYLWNRRTAEGLQKAIGYFDQAVGIYPNYALAWTGLADCYNLLSLYDLSPPRESIGKARAAAMKALELDNSLAEAHASLGWIKWVYDWDWSGAEREFKQAIELRSSYVTAHYWYGTCLAQRGEFEAAMAELRRAQRLDPLSLVTQIHLGWARFYQGQYDEAIAEYRKAMDLDPNFPWARFYLGQAYEQKRMYPEAIEELKKAVDLSSNSTGFLAALGHAYGESGMRDEAEKILRRLVDHSKRHYVSPYSIALVHAGLGNTDQAFASLQKAIEARSTRLVRLNVEPRFEKLRYDPRFTELVQRVGLRPMSRDAVLAR